MEPSDRSTNEQTVRMLEEEIAVLRRRLQDAPQRVRLLEERLLEIRSELGQATRQNDKLTTAVTEAVAPN